MKAGTRTSCGTCKFFRVDIGLYESFSDLQETSDIDWVDGECVRYPPTPLPEMHANNTRVCVHPVVSDFEECGEWRKCAAGTLGGIAKGDFRPFKKDIHDDNN